MTTPQESFSNECPAEALLRQVGGKWKPRIFQIATQYPLRFNRLLREVEGISKQALNTALKEMEQDGILDKKVIRQKPLHVEYSLTGKGQQMAEVLKGMEKLA